MRQNGKVAHSYGNIQLSLFNMSHISSFQLALNACNNQAESRYTDLRASKSHWHWRLALVPRREDYIRAATSASKETENQHTDSDDRSNSRPDTGRLKYLATPKPAPPGRSQTRLLMPNQDRDDNDSSKATTMPQDKRKSQQSSHQDTSGPSQGDKKSSPSLGFLGDTAAGTAPKDAPSK